MAAKRRKAAARAGAGGEDCRLRSPVKRSSNSSRRRRPAEGAQDGESPRGQRGSEETSSYKTPKRKLLARSCLPVFSSPLNETDVQQEIFWDPQSPSAYKLGNGQKKQLVSGHTVEISEIVNRIAPHDEKPSCSEGSLLGFWIGDDAIPCTPGMPKVRCRTKANGARGLRLRNREEELMKLAKQFDKSMTDAIQDQSAPCHNSHIISETMISVEHQDEAQVENQQHFLREHPRTDDALPSGEVKTSAGTVEHCENSSQKSIDLDAEEALNALFDGPTQQCSGQLSEGLSDFSLNDSLLEEGCPSDEFTTAPESVAEDAHQRQDSSPAMKSMEHFPAEKAKMASEQTVPSADSSEIESIDGIVGDDFDDWGADLLPDDSFLMQITQNPEVIDVPQNTLAHTSNETSEAKEGTIDSEKPCSAHCAVLYSSNSVPASHAVEKQSVTIGKTKGVLHDDCNLKPNKQNSISKSKNKISASVKPEKESIWEGFTQLKPAIGTSSSGKKSAFLVHSDVPVLQTEKYRNGMHSICHQSSTVSANTRPHNLKKVAKQASTGHLTQMEVPKKSVLSFDNWNEPRFSDQVLELFCESNSLWGTSCDDADDDNLLYQVCGDVEKTSLSQVAVKENEEAKLVIGKASKLEVGPCLSGPTQELSNVPQPQKSRMGRKTFSFHAPVTDTTLRMNESCSNSSDKHRWAQFNSVPGKLSRSSSVPGDCFTSVTDSTTLSNMCLSVNNIQWQKDLCHARKVQNSGSINQVPAEKSEYAFRKTNSSQDPGMDHKNVNAGNLSRTNVALGESKNPANVLLQTAKQLSIKPGFKRHLSECFSQSETEQKSRKCSQEEIARKKQEALERRKCKMQALLKNTAPI
ncbi:ewing's tumor-associated antigen 1 isoform X1 [Zootoca vivipara]|uniref:ewing's tumor-associated antigen 1 isoform X1 n=1 Tax=Zootoca vivipara TaxID=8524 RepID=UPI00293B9511|nr:ewing's tumor-associated antigen 1 isoform X1 [Zootoca vivipara]